MFLFSPSPSFVLSQSVFFFRMFFFSLPSLSFVLSLPLSLLCFFFPLPPLSSPSLSSPGFLFFSLFQRSWALFIEAKGAVFYSSHGEQPAGRPLGAVAEVRWVVRGGWSAIVSGRWAPGERVSGRNSN